jgi:hypothetical protein
MNREYIILHHSLTKDGKTVSWDDIRRYHVETRGWSDVGYHWGIEKVDNSIEIFMGRMPDRIGAHAKEMQMNSRSLGICVVGNFDVSVPEYGIMQKLEELLNWLMWEYKIPAQNVLGHRDVGLMAGFDWEKGQYKSCPGKKFPLFELKERLIF